MSFIADPIANFLSTYGTPLAKIFGISPKIPLVCAITPDGTALGGAGTVGDTDFLTNFTAAAGGAEAVKAFDVSRPVGLMCMVNPDGTAYSAASAPAYMEYLATFTTTKDVLNEITIASEIINTLGGEVTAAAAVGGTIDGLYVFSLPEGVMGDKTKTVFSVNMFAEDGFPIDASVFSDAEDTVLVSAKFLDGTGASPYNGNVGTASYCSINIKIYP